MSKPTSQRVPTARRRPSTPSSKASTPKKGFRSRHPVVSALVPVALVLAVLATMVLIKVTSDSSPSAVAASQLHTGGTTGSSDPGTTALPASVVAALNVPAATLESVGSPSSVVAPSRTGDAGAVARGSDGKPLITYIGAEYCPYCAAERWAIAVALSRFGTFTNLSATHSASNDVYPDTQTISFYGSSYASSYVDFAPVEEATNQAANGSYAALQQPTAQQSNLIARYDSQGSIPFLDIANKYVVVGASYSPQVLAGLSQVQIAAQLANPNSPVAQAIDGAANQITAAIVLVTGQQPGSIANAPAIASIAKSLGA